MLLKYPNSFVRGVAKTTCRFGDSLGLLMYLYLGYDLLILQQKDTKQNSIGKKHVEQSLQKARHKIPRVLSWWSYTGSLHFSSNEG